MQQAIQHAVDLVRREAFVEFAEVVLKIESGGLLDIRRALQKQFNNVLITNTRQYFGLRMAIAVVRYENDARMEENI